MNPYDDTETLGLSRISFDDRRLHQCDFDILCFWSTEDGRVFSASDSGQSDHVPFEDYSGKTRDDILSLLERVGSLEQAGRIFDSWNEKNQLPMFEKQLLLDWVKNHIKA